MFEEIKNQIAELLDLDPAVITPESDLVKDLKADSMDIATLLLEVEEKTGVDIDEDELANLHTVGDIVAYFEKKK